MTEPVLTTSRTTAAVDPGSGVAADQVFVIATGPDGQCLRAARARAVSRPDVNAYFRHPELGDAGFEALLNTAGLKGSCTLKIYVEHKGGLFLCPATVQIRN